MKLIGKKEQFFAIAIFFAMLRKFVGLLEITNSNSNLLAATMMASLLALLVTILCDSFTLFDIALCLYGLVSYNIANDSTLLYFTWMIVAAKNIEIKKIVYIWYIIQKIVMLGCIVFYPFLFIAGSSLAKTGYISGRHRFFFFFSHPNNFSVQLVFCVLAFVYLNYNRIQYWKINVIIILTSIFIYLFPNTITAVVSLLTFFILLFMMRYMKFITNNILRYALPTAVIFVTVITMSVYNGVGNQLITLINSAFTGRFTQAAVAFQIYSVNFWGQQLDSVGNLVMVNGDWNHLWVDIGYIRMLLAFGIVGSAIFMGYLVRAFKIQYKQKMHLELILLTTICIYAMSEWSAFSIVTTFPLFLLSDVRENRMIRLKKIKIGI